MSAWQRLRRFQQDMQNRRLPLGMLGWRFLLPGVCPRERLHRRLWWQAPRRLPRVLWLWLETGLWLRWVCWLALPACRQALARHGAEVVQQHGISLPRQYRQLRHLALARCWPPALYYRYQLYLPGRSVLDYVAPSETAAFHRWRDGSLHPAQLALLADKEQSAAQLAAAGIPVARTLLTLTPGMPDPDWQQLPCRQLFAKPRHGSRSQHCYQVQVDEAGQAHCAPFPHATADEAAWRASRQQQTLLLQPCYRPARALHGLTQGDLTLRILTRRQSGGFEVTHAWLEIAVEDQTYQWQPLSLSRGLPIAPFIHDDMPARWQQAGLASLPHWQDAANHACHAHAVLAPDLCSVAWDVMLPEEGAILLEGNSTWNVMPPQILYGGLLAPPNLTASP